MRVDVPEPISNDSKTKPDILCNFSHLANTLCCQLFALCLCLLIYWSPCQSGRWQLWCWGFASEGLLTADRVEDVQCYPRASQQFLSPLQIMVHAQNFILLCTYYVLYWLMWLKRVKDIFSQWQITSWCKCKDVHSHHIVIAKNMHMVKIISNIEVIFLIDVFVCTLS